MADLATTMTVIDAWMRSVCSRSLAGARYRPRERSARLAYQERLCAFCVGPR
jgi:hypothetical protein